MRELNLDNCQYLTRIHDVSNLPNLEIFSFQDCKNLIEIHKSVGFLNKLEHLNTKGCPKLLSFPPLKSTALRKLELSYCEILMTFPEILGEMKNISSIHLEGTSIEKVPVSFQNLTGLQFLIIKGKGMLRLPSSILRMPNLYNVTVNGCIFPKLDNKLSSMTINLDRVSVNGCNLSDEFLPIIVTWSANVTTLDLSGNNFTILPECIKDCRSLWYLKLDDCKCLREIRGIPPKLKWLSAKHCKSLTSSCRNMLLNQKLHEAGGTKFLLPGFAKIPEWFEHQNMGQTFSFWFRNELPSMALYFSTTSIHFDLGMKTPTLIINGDKFYIPSLTVEFGNMLTHHHTYLYDMKLEFHQFSKMNFQNEFDKRIFKSEWIRAELTCEHWNMEPPTEIGIHFFKQKNNMDDIQFTNPYEKIKLNDNDDDDVFYDADDVLHEDDNDGVFYDVDNVLDDEDDHHSQ